MDFVALNEQLNQRKTPCNVSELHGLLTGWFSAGSRWSVAEQAGILTKWMGDEPINETLTGLVSTLAVDTLAALTDEEFGFQLLVPDDNVEINSRSRALSQWCEGFLSGFGMTGRYQQSDLNADVAEIFSDLARIAGVEEEIPDSEENEIDLMEIIEYVRVSVLLVYTECANQSVR